MRNFKKPIFILIVIAIVIYLSTVVYCIIDKFQISSYFFGSWDFAQDMIFEREGLAKYISAYFAQSTTLLVIYSIVSCAVIAFALSLYSKNRVDALSLALVPLFFLVREYLVNISSGLLVGLVLIIIYFLPLRKIVGKLIALLLLASLYYTVLFNVGMAYFAGTTVLYIVMAQLVLPLFKEKVVVSSLFAVAVIAVCGYFLRQQHNPALMHVVKMELAVINEDWDKVLELNKNSSTNNTATCYYTNVALIKSGRLNDELFHHKQTSGNKGFELPESYYLSDLIFDIVGFPNLGLKSSYEYYSIYGKSYASLERILYYFNKCGKDRVHDKLSRLMPNYKKKESTDYVTTNMDSMFRSEVPQLVEHAVNKDPNNKVAFEVLMAYYALSGRVHKFVSRIPQAMKFFPDGLPTYYQEVLIIYEELTEYTNEVMDLPPIDPALRVKFAKHKSSGATLYPQSYWYYAQNINPDEVKFYND
ncbi:MAG: DUF6057 family protein [Rikenellaceae bacterium]